MGMGRLCNWALWASVVVCLPFCYAVQLPRRDYDDESYRSELENDLLEKIIDGEEAKRAFNEHPNQMKHRSIRSITNNTNNATGSTASPTLRQIATVKSYIDRRTHPALEINCGDKVYSCKNKCKQETTYDIFSSLNSPSSQRDCYCDRGCNNIFYDCCSDYRQACSMYSTLRENDDFYKLKNSWRCTTINVNAGKCARRRGAWMVARCPNLWSNDAVKTKCHNPASTLAPHSVLLYVPVVGVADLFTYRNQYCALCNNVSNFEFWTLIFVANAIPPSQYTRSDLTEFIAKNQQYFNGIRPKEGQRIRWCSYPNVTSTCSTTSNEESLKDCLQGTTGLVEEMDSGIVFKSKACASCNGYSVTCGVAERNINPCSIDSSAISRAISLRDYGVSEVTRSCRKNAVYDKAIGKCRQTYVIKKLNFGYADEYQITMSALPKTAGMFFIILPYELKNSLSDYFKVNKSKLNDPKITRIYSETDPKILIEFRIRLTQKQSLILASDAKLNGSSNETIILNRLFRFKRTFKLPIGLQTFTIYRQEIRQLNCTRPQVYQYEDYDFLDDLSIRVLSTGAVYEQFEYYMDHDVKNASVTVCSKFVTRQCNGSYIKLNSSEFHFTSNLSLVYNSVVYRFADYIYDDGTVFICVDFEKEYTTLTDTNLPKDDLALVILTWIGFVLSIIGLLALFFTYLIFKELRTLPGKNLMNLCISLCLAEIFWLFGSTLDSYPTTCTAVAIANHYFFLAFFTASSVIAFHSWLVFGRKINLRRSAFDGSKIFIMYFLVVWGLPGLFLVLFGLLDHFEIFVINYGESLVCWLGTKESKIFLFIFPFGVLLLFNLVLFMVVVFRLRQNRKSSDKALGDGAKKREMQNIKVCLKLSTLMGFSWLFGLLQVAVETKTDAFAYMFIIFVSFQGLFICAAFLLQKKCYELYNTLISKNFSSSKATSTGVESPTNVQKSGVQETKL
ncbi:uncharacterized protein LOC114529641 [Dendronephthya gigantea]|uniref:uncharacterized protein LOC114529641 n=1 Tax=Dendronephthya gigantea TaxID=151771 RepID=UPI001069AB20|nr:uncharacterized protein LOC114529641 [Dendronephthya gigantea]